MTAGSLAFAAILVRVRFSYSGPDLKILRCRQARWAISPDDCFEPIGQTSRINYFNDFMWYRKYIQTGLDCNKRATLNLIVKFNKVLFPEMFKTRYEEPTETEMVDAFAELEGGETFSV